MKRSSSNMVDRDESDYLKKMLVKAKEKEAINANDH